MFNEDKYDRNACGGLFFVIVIAVLVALVACVIVFTARPREASAAELNSRWFAGVRYSAFRPDDDDFRYKQRHELQKLGSFEAGYSFNEHLALSVEYGTQRFKAKYFPVSFRDHYILLNARSGILVRDRILLYGVVGIGAHIYSDKKIPWYYEHFWDCRITKDAGFGMKYGGGAEIFVTEDWAVTAEIAYHYADTGKGSSFDVWGWAAGVGVKYYF